MQRIVSTAFATLLLGLPLTGLFKLLVTAGQGSNDGQLGRPMQP